VDLLDIIQPLSLAIAVTPLRVWKRDLQT